MREGSQDRGLPLLGFAVVGLVVGHALSYLLTIPDPHQRAFALQATGHDYLPLLTQAGLVLLLASVVALFVQALGSPGRHAGSFGSTARFLIVVQVIAFVGQEVLERLVTHIPVSHLLHEPLLPVGVVIQVTIAVAGAALLRWFVRATSWLVTALSAGDPGGRRTPVVVAPSPRVRPVGRVLAASISARAPPIP